MGRRVILLTVVGLFVIAAAGVLTAHTAGIVVGPSYAGVTQVGVHIAGDSTIVQRAPFGDTVGLAQSGDSFSDHLKVVVPRDVSFIVTSPNSSLSVTSQGKVTTVGGPLTPGTYTVSGTDSDSAGESGTWSYTLAVTAGSGEN